jgi:3-deoxy-7-phosphoheptulonate synthase
MSEVGLPAGLLVDCSHGNSRKQALAQGHVWEKTLEFHQDAEPRVFGAMLESFLETGRQDLHPNQSLLPGLSITDSCVGWAETEELILKSAEKLRRKPGVRRRRKNSGATARSSGRK